MKDNTENGNFLNRRQFLKVTAATGAAGAILPASSLLAADGGQKVTLGFVGCAHIHTPGFINLLKDRKDVRVKTVWDHDRERASRRAKELNAAVAEKADEIYADPEIQAVVICAETNRHLDLVLGAARGKKHMFVEKPLGIGSQDSYRMQAAIEKAGLLFTTGYFMRCNPAHIFLKEEIAKGSFGKITRIEGSNCHSGSLGKWFDTEWRWMADPKIAGVGAFGDLGTHSLDIMMWMMGDVESVTAQVKVVTGHYGDCDEAGAALIRFKNGVYGTLTAGWVDVANPVTLQISGTEGYATIINGQLFFTSKKVEGADGKQPWTKLPPAPAAPMHLFVDSVAGKSGLPLVTPKEAAARASVMEAMYAAARSNRWVEPT
ncbi:MAG TPA: Gfo/Idh/MocA family oxidoreductase [Candidatus Paceibacterota bacterium]|nr:Gfo/Idh/MocA family oxidoreductase [Verrucomicrobiota bacterium]HRY50425.1 Gfo/Idh/MocA family oxidoreductase [Candidatus Paceibacterota bacterium]HRZ99502.1 Gfo/Idh/MocA family oxidoreductase [Candidatus Paceibacterota bacterium]